jgi:hypothetical protein
VHGCITSQPKGRQQVQVHAYPVHDLTLSTNDTHPHETQDTYQSCSQGCRLPGRHSSAFRYRSDTPDSRWTQRQSGFRVTDRSLDRCAVCGRSPTEERHATMRLYMVQHKRLDKKQNKTKKTNKKHNNNNNKRDTSKERENIEGYLQLCGRTAHY